MSGEGSNVWGIGFRKGGNRVTSAVSTAFGVITKERICQGKRTVVWMLLGARGRKGGGSCCGWWSEEGCDSRERWGRNLPAGMFSWYKVPYNPWNWSVWVADNR